MKIFLRALVLLPLISQAQSQRQTTYLATPDCYVEGFTPLAGGGNLLTGYSQYGTDSCLVNMIFLNDSDEIQSHHEFNTATHIDFASCIQQVSNGFLIGGKSSDPNFFHPELISTDMNGNVLWAKYFDNTSYWQGQLIRIIPDGNNYSMYTFAETPVSDFYRIQTDVNGSTFSGQQFTCDTTMSYRVFDAEAMPNSSSHILCGHGNFNSSTTRGGVLMKTTPAGVQWCKHITAGGNFKNDIVDVTAAADGNSYSLFVCENMPGNQYSTIVMKFDSAGNKVWAKQLALSSGTLNGCSIIESNTHDFYVATYDNLLVAYITKIDASGSVLWTHKWTPSLTGGVQALKLFKDGAGNIVLTGMLAHSYFVARLDANAGGCGFTNTSVVNATTAVTVLTNISFTTVTFTPAIVSEPVVYSGLVYSENMICGGVGVDEVQSANPLTVYPDPASAFINISQESGIESVKIFNSLGQEIFSGKCSGSRTTVDVSTFPSGLYQVCVSKGDKVFQRSFMKQ